MNEIRDFHNRKINYLRISLTSECNLRCFYCFSKENLKTEKKREILTDEEILKIVKIATEMGIEKIRLTGGEPLLREGINRLVEKISHIEKIRDFSLTTNGILLKNFARSLKNSGLKRINISLDSLIYEKYKKITGGGNLKDVLEGIESAQKVNFSPIKINVVVLKNINEEEIPSFINFARKNSLTVRFIEFMPLLKTYKIWEKFYVSEKEILKRIEDDLEKKIPVEKGEVAKYYPLKGGGEVGIISSISNRFCSTCNRFRITADGNILPCLWSKNELELRKILRNGAREEEIKKIFLKAASLKLDFEGCIRKVKKAMFQIGG